MSTNRRDFLKMSSLLGLSSLATGLVGSEKINAFEKVADTFSDAEGLIPFPKLPYAYDALEPFIDKQTMEIHYSKHHKGYTDKLNTVPAVMMDFKASDEAKCAAVNESSPALLRNNLGGYYNHLLFWQLMKANPQKTELKPIGKLAEAITYSFTSFENFKKEFSEKASKIFGSGWCWLIIDENNKLKITTTPNQDNTLMQVASEKGRPVLCLDVWEHAYYLKHQNKRTDYIANWWMVVNWEKAEELYTSK